MSALKNNEENRSRLSLPVENFSEVLRQTIKTDQSLDVGICQASIIKVLGSEILDGNL